MTAKGLQKCVAHCSSAALQLCSTAGEDLLTADSPGIKYHPTLKFWPGRDTNFDKLINYPTGDLWTGRLVPAG